MKRSFLMALVAMALMPEAQASAEPAICESEVYGWTAKELRQITRQELARSFCAASNAVSDQIVPCLEDAYDWLGDVAQAGRRVELAFLTCSNVVQASESTDFLLFDVNTKSRASSCLQKVWDENSGLAEEARYQKAAETCLEVLAVAPAEHAENAKAPPAADGEEPVPVPPPRDEDAFGPN